MRQVDSRQSLPHKNIEVIQSARSSTDQDLIFTRLGIGHVFVGENFGSTELMNADGFH